MTAGPSRWAVVFDMDGVLIDSAPCHRAAFEEVFLPFGVTDFRYEDYAGWRTAEVVRHVLRTASPALTPAQIEEVSARKSRLAREKIVALNPVVPGCVAVLERLAGCLLLALASSGSRESVDLFLESNRCRHLFLSVLCGDQVEHAKPHPEIYLRSFGALGVEPRNGIVVEDAISGVEAARAAGAGEIIGIAGTVPPSALIAAGASRVLDALGELPELICENYEPAASR